MVAAFFATGKVEMLAKEIEQHHPRFDLDGAERPIDLERNTDPLNRYGNASSWRLGKGLLKEGGRRHVRKAYAAGMICEYSAESCAFDSPASPAKTNSR